MAAWMELLGMLGGTLETEAEGVSVTQNSMRDLLGTYFAFTNKTVPNSDQMGLPADHIPAADAALMGAVLVAQRAAQPVTPVAVVATTSDVGAATSIAGVTPVAPLVYYFTDPDDITLFAEAPKDTVYHSQIGIITREDDFTWISAATEFRIQRYTGHAENLTLVKDWTLLTEVKNSIIWDYYIRAELVTKYRIQFRNSSSTTEWSAWDV